jgi:hypothetical protein
LGEPLPYLRSSISLSGANSLYIKVPPEYQTKYEGGANHDACSKNDQDIDIAEYFEHYILLKDNKSMFQK